ncbi:MAG: SDR family oxidoreductase [Candidatus Eremiobacteraeota bacterium]|nr:SDR family oxidoreductase [Candidatus Eremiobacteraeota bacterium]
MRPSFISRVALVTGGAAGLPRGIVIALARDRYDVHFTFRPGGTGPEATLSALETEGVTARAHAVDFLAKPAEVSKKLDEITRESSPDVLVHGVGPMIVRRFERTMPEDYDAMIDGNLRSAVQISEAFLPGMRARKFGRMVFFGMSGSNVTMPARGLSLYAAAKSGLVAFARTLALEEGRNGVTVHVIQPGDIRDKYRSRDDARKQPAENAVGRPGSWEDVADVVRFLIREESDYLTGTVIDVGGGLTGPYERKN